jgi:predicted Holliday junction resolvase-like endonuclease
VEPALIIAASALVSIALLSVIIFLIKQRFERRFLIWQQQERELLELERNAIRKQAISQSRAVLGGRFTEQMAPFLPEFKYDPTEARFIGSPVDMLIFPGLSQGNPSEIVIMEIKNGPSAQLTPVERKIQKLVEEGMVRWELLERSSDRHLPQPENDQPTC